MDKKNQGQQYFLNSSKSTASPDHVRKVEPAPALVARSRHLMFKRL